MKSQQIAGSLPPKRFSRWKPVFAGVLVLAIFAVLTALALRPRQQREQEVLEELELRQSAPVVLVSQARVSPVRGELLLPGSVQALLEAPILARAEGYLRQRWVDMGDRVQAGQLLAAVEAPEVDKQVQQAQATLARAEASLAQAKAALEQSTTQLKLSEVTAQRWNTLFSKRVVSRQEADEKQAAFEARQADNAAARASVTAAEEGVGASQAELQRLLELKKFQEIRAPFSGIITSRNTDVGALIRSSTSEGRELFRLAQIDTVRVMIQVPQSNIPAIRLGEPAVLKVQERPGLQFSGKIVRTANALDTATRTLLTEIHVPNPDFLLLPGMYAEVRLANAKSAPAILVSGDTLMIRADGPQVAIVGEGGKVHFQKIVLGRDYGAESEVAAGLAGGERLVINPGDEIQEGVVVKIQKPPEASPASRQIK